MSPWPYLCFQILCILTIHKLPHITVGEGTFISIIDKHSMI
jgi:hypothetical protein